MTPLPPGVGIHQTTSPLQAFTGTIARSRTRPLYSAGLAVVAFAMVLLPLLYLAIIALTGWLVVLHLLNNTWIIAGSSGHAGFLRILMYLGPAIAGGILVFFMVKPFFAPKAKAPDPITLDPRTEPLLFAFVEKICGLVGAPPPCRIDVDCQVNASASLRRGLWSKDLVLTIGLPLASGLDLRQFAGVLAHEFGHFAQGAGMRLTYVIRRVNFWFSRVVYERDHWDVQLDNSAKTADWRIRLVLEMARGCVWLSRRILWALMRAGHAISCFMLRQMEFDADSYEAKVAGSDTFELTALRLPLLSVATQTAYEDVRQSWASKRLPENLPLLIHHKAGCLPEELQQKISASAAAQKTNWFDTHPCDADRIREARRLNEPGVFRLTEPATALFSDFVELSKRVTRHQYEKQFELEFTDENLMPAEEILSESTASAEAEARIREYYAGVHIALKPLLLTGELTANPIDDNSTKTWRTAHETTVALRAEAEALSAECVAHQKRLVDLVSAHQLAKAGFRLQPDQFGLPADRTTPGDQEVAARLALQETKAALAEGLAKLDPFMEALRQRVTIALCLGLADRAILSPEQAREVAQFARLLAAVGAEMSRVHEMGCKLNAFALLGQNRPNHSAPARVDAAACDLASELKTEIASIQERLQPCAYPFPHARGQLTIAEYARSEDPAESELARVYQDAHAHVQRLFPLHYRLLGRLLTHVHAVEEKLQIDPHDLGTLPGPR